jgi:predicted RNA polymerase sigma factor
MPRCGSTAASGDRRRARHGDHPEQTDWQRIAGLYAILAERFRSPIVELNRAVAVSMVHGPAAD